MDTEDTDVEAGPCLSEHQAGARAGYYHARCQLSWWESKHVVGPEEWFE